LIDIRDMGKEPMKYAKTQVREKHHDGALKRQRGAHPLSLVQLSGPYFVGGTAKRNLSLPQFLVLLEKPLSNASEHNND
jgi:hypothetical protein